MLNQGLLRLRNGVFKSISRLILFSFVMIFSPTSWAEANNAGNMIVFNRPPDSLANWYAPVAKRSVWLHTMYRLQRAMAAMDDYASKGQRAELLKWSEIFSKDYESIKTMVPEWAGYLRQDQLKALDAAVTANNFDLIAPILETVGETCTRCHGDYQAITVLLYRSPDFSQQSIRVNGSNQVEDYDDAMRKLGNTVNRINIAIKDDYLSNALDYIPVLEEQLHDLSTSCSNCHGEDRIPVGRIYDASERLLPELTEAIKTKDSNQAGIKLGTFAVEFCGRCHGVHRIISNLKAKID